MSSAFPVAVSPGRAALCLECRTALGPHERRCDRGHRRVVVLETEEGRSQLLQEVWGAPGRRARIKGSLRSGAAGLITGAFIAGFEGGCTVGLHAGELFVIGPVLGLLAAVGNVALVSWRSRRRQRLLGSGRAALALPELKRCDPTGGDAGSRMRLPLSGTTRHVGLAAGEATLRSPVQRTPCLAYGLELRHVRVLIGGHTMLQDAECVRFVVTLDSGQRVRLSAGRVRFRPGSEDEVLDAVTAAVEEHVRARFGWTHWELPPFPFDRVREQVLRPGDRVEILSPLRPDPQHVPEGGPYRDAAGPDLVPDGIPVLRRLG